MSEAQAPASDFPMARQLVEEVLCMEAPWVATKVETDSTKKVLKVQVEHAAGATLQCPCCDFGSSTRHDHAWRELRDLNWCEHQVCLKVRVPRIRCPVHGVRRVELPWVSKARVQSTRRFERLVLADLKTCSVLETARRHDISADQVQRITNDAVARGQRRRQREAIPRIGVDETSFKRGHDYVTVVNDLEGRVLHVALGRDAEALDSYFDSLDEGDLQGLEYVVMDMSPAFIGSVHARTDANIVFDKHHVIAMLNRMVDQVRRAEHKRLLAVGDDRLKGTAHLWHRSAHRMTASQRETLHRLNRQVAVVARAWRRVEMVREIWSQRTWEATEQAWKAWLKSARLSRIKPLRKVADTIETHLAGILNAAVTDLTNARAEALNATIQKIKRTAHGYRNKDSFITAISFHCGDLDMSF